MSGSYHVKQTHVKTERNEQMKKEITVPVIMFDEDNIDIRKILDLLEVELTELAESSVKLDWKCLQLI